jgi:CO/xanthine dehydrogenase FAD-binding subunit
MPIAHPTSLTEVYDALDDMPDAHLLAGGTDFMVEVNFGHRSPTSIVCLRRVDELQGYSITDDEVVLGAGTTWTEVENDLVDVLPALAAAARTVGSPQMRNAGTVGGNVGTASPAGDGLPVLAAMDATVVLARREGTREFPLLDFITGVKRTGIEPGEVIWQIKVPRLDGPQEFLKVGTRNAMVISIVCCALIMDRVGRTVRLGLGSVSPRPLRATEAEAFAAEAMDWEALSAPPDAIARFGELAQQAATPISDQRGTADYRAHAVGVIAARALERSVAA